MRYLALLLLTGFLAACGQKGPLYLPAKPPVAAPAPQPNTADAEVDTEMDATAQVEAVSHPETHEQP